MHFAFNEDQELLRTTTRRFLEQRHPRTALRPKLEATDAFDPAVWRDGAALGWTALLVPDSLGGGSVTDQPLVDLVGIAEELGRVLYPGPFLPTNVVADAIARSGDDAHWRAQLPAIAAGECIAAWCHTSDGRADAASISVTAWPASTGLRLEGRAASVQDAHVADLLLVSANAPDGPVLVLVPAAAAGVDIRVLRSLDLTRRHCVVDFRDVVVTEGDVLASSADARSAISRALQIASVVKAAECVGAADELFAMTVQYAKDRMQFGRPIGSFQAIKHRLADLLIELEGMRAASHYAAMALADDRRDAAEAVHVAASYAPDAFVHLAGEALQLHGGIGFTWEHDVHLFVRRAQSDRALYGDPAWHREQLCRLLETDAEAG